MARADRRQAERQARRVERRPRAARRGAAGRGRHDVLPEAPQRTRSGSSCSSSIVFADELRLPRRRLGLVRARRPPAGQLEHLFGSSTAARPRRSSKDQKLIEKNPKDYAAYKDLARGAGRRRQDRRRDRDAPEAEGRQPEGRRRPDAAREPLPAQGRHAPHRRDQTPRPQAQTGQPARLRARAVDDARQGVPELHDADRRPLSQAT